MALLRVRVGSDPATGDVPGARRGQNGDREVGTAPRLTQRWCPEGERYKPRATKMVAERGCPLFLMVCNSHG